LGFALVICNKGPSEKKIDKTDKTKIQSKNHPGKKLMETKCYACHNPISPEDQRIGPPMIAIKKHYINENTSKEEFIKDFVSFVKNPSEDNAKMRGAVRKFGVMPKQYFKEEDLKAIAEYMYDNEIEKPEWFQKHWEERGIMVRNSVLLIDFVNLRLAEGIPFKQAVIEAGAVRTTPILLTAGTVVIGAFVILI
jgi:cytochrome c2